MIHLVVLLLGLTYGRIDELAAEVPAISWRGESLGTELSCKEHDGRIVIAGDRLALRFDPELGIGVLDRAAFDSMPGAPRALAEIEAAARLDLETGARGAQTGSGLAVRSRRGLIIDAARSGDGRGLAVLETLRPRLTVLPFLSAGRTGSVIRLVVTGEFEERRLLRLGDLGSSRRLIWCPGDESLIVFDTLHMHFVQLPLGEREKRR